jgi:hypothetical protein
MEFAHEYEHGIIRKHLQKIRACFTTHLKIWSGFSKKRISNSTTCGFPEEEMEKILLGFSEKAEAVIEGVKRQLPNGFPEDIADSIFEGTLRECASIQL